MTTSILWQYDAATAVTWGGGTGMDNLPAGSRAISTSISNSSNFYDDFLMSVTVAAITPSGNGAVEIWASQSIDNSVWSGDSSSNMGIMAHVGFMDLIGTGPWTSRAFSVANAFGGKVPPYFKLIICNNNAGITSFAGVGSGNSTNYSAIYRTVT